MQRTVKGTLGIVSAALALATGGCGSHRDTVKPRMTQAEANQQLQKIANDPSMPETARAAAQQGVDEGQAQQMLGQGR